ncbi:SPFH domain-containing protein [Nocardiopsis lambiniae]|uniref:SPFH domain-containing protein n=1 Tax=Nocardiopsis lambiniae TaxID=3075539 RepID=A0ABU2MC33_9ACTN|nr:SPFH domain-containing protein [Nocardiopsis sp. DSM 44743]MDT0330233.1 SPFH domain-containing protein [Nocardiopsis sp. DSM 44743]
MTPRGMSAAITATLTALVLTACSVSTGPDKVGLEYDAGAFSSTTFDSCILPGNRQYHGPGDQTFLYPAGQRTFEFSGADGAETHSATVVSKDDLELTVTGLVTFSLNIECERLQEFHERLGLKYIAYEDPGWVDLLRDYIGQPLNRALDDATKEYAWRDLYTSAEAKAEWEKKVGDLTSAYIAEQGGGEFFCSPTYTGGGEDCGTPQLTIQQPTPPEEVRKALTLAQEAVEMTTAQEQENERIDKELEAIEELVEVLGPEGYILYQALKDGKVDFMPIPYGSGVNVTPRGGN